MTKYCDAHGAVEIDDHRVNTCPKCQTVLKDTPEALVGRVSPVWAGQSVTPSARDAEVEARQSAFLIAFERYGMVGRAAEEAGISRQSHYRYLKDPLYAARFQESMVIAFGLYEDETIRRAMLDSDRLMEKVLESLGPKVGRPEWARATKHEHSGPEGKGIPFDVSPSEQLLSRIAGLVTGGGTPQGS